MLESDPPVMRQESQTERDILSLALAKQDSCWWDTWFPGQQPGLV
jgi:hypothetical protein